MGDLKFALDIKRETFQTMRLQYDLSDEFESLLENSKIVRIDYTQFLEGEHQQDNTENGRDTVFRILSTVAIEAANKLKNEQFDIVYFAAKEHQDQSKNTRKTLYPRIGKSLAAKLHMSCFCSSLNSPDVITILVKNLSPENTLKLRSLI